MILFTSREFKTPQSINYEFWRELIGSISRKRHGAWKINRSLETTKATATAALITNRFNEHHSIILGAFLCRHLQNGI